MTAPVPEIPDPESLAHEQAAVEDVTGELAAALAGVMAGVLAAYAAGKAGEALGAVVRSLLAAVSWAPMTPLLQAVAVESVDLGIERTLRDLPARDRREGRPGRRPALEVPDLDAVTRARLGAAGDLTRDLKMDTKVDVMRVVGAVSTAKSRAEGQVRWTANEGLNAGTAATVRKLGRALIWVAERDGCLHCLAHAGWSVRPGQTFPAGLTYGDRPIREDGVPYPPLHPNCRCQVRVWDGPVGRPPGGRSSASAAARLAAEARRSVVYGWTEHASHAATIRAMDRLLRAGAGLPVSVERRARDLVRQRRTMSRPR